VLLQNLAMPSCIPGHCNNTLHEDTATPYTSLRRTPTHYNTLQHTAHCNTHTATHSQHPRLLCVALQHTTTHCNTLHTAKHTLQHTAQCKTPQHAGGFLPILRIPCGWRPRVHTSERVHYCNTHCNILL